jgi:hypothetical protein
VLFRSLDAGKLNGKQYIMPLHYDLFTFVTSEASRSLLFPEDDAELMSLLPRLRAMLSEPQTGSMTLAAANDFFMNPYSLSNPPLIDFDTGAARIDTPATRAIMDTFLYCFQQVREKIGGHPPYVDPYSSEPPAELYALIPTADYLAYDRTLLNISGELAACDQAGIPAYVDAVPTTSGGVTAVINSYAGIRANSAYKTETAELIKILLSDKYQTFIDIMLPRLSFINTNFPVRAGLLAEKAQYQISHTMAFMAGWINELSEHSLHQLEALEASVTGATFALPTEVAADCVLGIYQTAERGKSSDADAMIERMQRYWDIYLSE